MKGKDSEQGGGASKKPKKARLSAAGEFLRPPRRGARGERRTDQKKTSKELRLQKDISELNLGKTIAIDLEGSLLEFRVTVKPDEGYYKKGEFVFLFNIKKSYPHEPPKVKCLTDVYHPNIDEEGKVCLNILREDWKPVLSISAVIYGLMFLFLDPNPSDPLNKEAAETLKKNPKQFERNVRQMIQHGYY